MSVYHFFVDLKRFEVAEKYGGICRDPDPVAWAGRLIRRSVELGLDRRGDIDVTYYFPESCIVPAMEAVRESGCGPGLNVGSQGLYRRDTSPGGDYGAMTGTRPASAMISLGCCRSLVAHSDERRDKFQLMADYDPEIMVDPEKLKKAWLAVDRACAEEARRALERDMRILYCIGETAEQKGPGAFEEYAPRVEFVLRQQLEVGLGELRGSPLLDNVCLTYEPVWAIGPGKKTPGAGHVAFASGYMKQLCREMLGRELPIVYGGGLKVGNAGEIASVSTIDGGFNGLSRFVPPIAFEPYEYLEIIEAFLEGKRQTYER